MHVAIICYIADPFDPPGHERFGGGHLFLFDLGRYLVRNGLRVTFITRRNSEDKPIEDRFGSNCTVFRLPVGPPEEIPVWQVAQHLSELERATNTQLKSVTPLVDVVHSHYWIAGEVSRRLRSEKRFRHIHSVLSLGRVKRELGEPTDSTLSLRDRSEVLVFDSVDQLVVVCPSEYEDLRRLYPEIKHDRVALIPYGVDSDEFYRRPESAGDYVRRATRRFSKRFNDPS